jgi:hypothetical protein
MPRRDQDTGFQAELDQLEAGYEAARQRGLAAREPDVDATERVLAMRAWQQAQAAVQSARQFWREIGEAVSAVDPAHDGARSGLVRVSNGG